MQIFTLPTLTVLLTLLGSSHAGIGCSPSFGSTFSKKDVLSLQKEIVLNWDPTTVPGPKGRWGLKWGTTQLCLINRYFDSVTSVAPGESAGRLAFILNRCCKGDVCQAGWTDADATGGGVRVIVSLMSANADCGKY
ncbi:hypothetical protein GQ44DRAFT_758647 [Phaeosphaeriaceae sp. PMI808]|nr:hypothetical protein GQ44DRAFT_758647 [Phaeosphaeriaceae sp. PMI808]